MTFTPDLLKPSSEMVHVKPLGWIRLAKTSSRMEFYRTVPRETLTVCRRQECRIACVGLKTGNDRHYFPKYAQGWWIETIKDKAFGHQFAFRNKWLDGKRAAKSTCIAHRGTGLCISQPIHVTSYLEFYGAVRRMMCNLELSLEDFCLLRLLQRMQKVHEQMSAAVSIEAAQSVSNLGLNPEQTLAEWMGAEAYERAGSAFVKLELS